MFPILLTYLHQISDQGGELNQHGKRPRFDGYQKMVLPFGNEPRRLSGASTGTTGTETTLVGSEAGVKDVDTYIRDVDEYLENSRDTTMKDFVAETEGEDPSKSLNQAINNLVTGTRERLLPSQQQI